MSDLSRPRRPTDREPGAGPWSAWFSAPYDAAPGATSQTREQDVDGPATAALAIDVDREDDILDLGGFDGPGSRRSRRTSVALGVALLVVAGFAGGVAVQKHVDSGVVTATATVRTSSAARFAAGGPGTRSGGAGSAGSGAGSGGGGVPVLVGTLTGVGHDTLRVRDFAGHVVTVRTTARTTATAPGLAGPRPGMTVALYGARSGATVTADAVTARAAG